LIVVGADAIDVALQCLVGPAKPHGTESADLPFVIRDLRLVFPKRAISVVQVNMHIECVLLRRRGDCGKHEQDRLKMSTYHPFLRGVAISAVMPNSLDNNPAKATVVLTSRNGPMNCAPMRRPSLVRPIGAAVAWTPRSKAKLTAGAAGSAQTAAERLLDPAFGPVPITHA
jgi:hypothetical protein